MPEWLTASRAAHCVGIGATLIAAVVVLATGSSVAYLGPVLVGGTALATLVGLLIAPRDADARARATPSAGSDGTERRRPSA